MFHFKLWVVTFHNPQNKWGLLASNWKCIAVRVQTKSCVTACTQPVLIKSKQNKVVQSYAYIVSTPEIPILSFPYWVVQADLQYFINHFINNKTLIIPYRCTIYEFVWRVKLHTVNINTYASHATLSNMKKDSRRHNQENHSKLWQWKQNKIK